MKNDRYLTGGSVAHWQYYPVIAFKAANGQTYTVNGNLSTPGSPAFKVFDNIPIAYNPNDPSRALKMLSGGNGELESAIMATVAGLIVLAIDLVLYRKHIVGGRWQQLTRKNAPAATQTHNHSSKPHGSRR